MMVAHTETVRSVKGLTLMEGGTPMLDLILILTNFLVVFATILAAFVTLADVNKEEQLTLREVVTEAIKGPKRHPHVEESHKEDEGHDA